MHLGRYTRRMAFSTRSPLAPSPPAVALSIPRKKRRRTPCPCSLISFFPSDNDNPRKQAGAAKGKQGHPHQRHAPMCPTTLVCPTAPHRTAPRLAYTPTARPPLQSRYVLIQTRCAHLAYRRRVRGGWRRSQHGKGLRGARRSTRVMLG